MGTVVATRPRQIEAGVVFRKQRSLWGDALHRMVRNRAAIAGLVVIALSAVIAIFAGYLAPFDPSITHSGSDLREPMWTANFGSKYTDPAYVLGTDQLGRDILSRLMYGARISLVVGFIPTAIVFVIAVTVGMLSGYFGGFVDNILMRFTDIVYAFPDLLFVIIIIATLRNTAFGDVMGGLVLIFVSFAIVGWVGLARLVRGQVLSLKNREFIEAARAVGSTSPRIMMRHILPNILAPIIVSVAFAIPGAIIGEATLSFLGIGIKPPTPSWGTMIQDGFVVFSTSPWPVLLPALCVSVLLLSFTFVGDGLRDALDPRMKI